MLTLIIAASIWYMMPCRWCLRRWWWAQSKRRARERGACYAEQALASRARYEARRHCRLLRYYVDTISLRCHWWYIPPPPLLIRLRCHYHYRHPPLIRYRRHFVVWLRLFIRLLPFHRLSFARLPLSSFLHWFYYLYHILMIRYHWLFYVIAAYALLISPTPVATRAAIRWSLRHYATITIVACHALFTLSLYDVHAERWDYAACLTPWCRWCVTHVFIIALLR